jgi:hypothetical protein
VFDGCELIDETIGRGTGSDPNDAFTGQQRCNFFYRCRSGPRFLLVGEIYSA